MSLFYLYSSKYSFPMHVTVVVVSYLPFPLFSFQVFRKHPPVIHAERNLCKSYLLNE